MLYQLALALFNVQKVIYCTNNRLSHIPRNPKRGNTHVTVHLLCLTPSIAIHHLHACSLSSVSDSQKRKLSTAGSKVQVKEKSFVLFESFRFPRSSMLKGKLRVFSRLSSNRCYLRGYHIQESGGWDTSSHTSLFIRLSRGSRAHAKSFICSQKSFFSPPHFFYPC